MSIDNVDTSNENLVKVDLPTQATQGEEARGKHAAPETTLAAPLKSFAGQAADSAPKLAGAFEGATPGPEFGEAVNVAAKPNRVPGGTTVVPLKSFPGQTADSVPKLARAFKGATPGPEFGEAVNVAAKPNRVPGGTTVVRDSLSFVPETGKKNGGNSGDSDPASTKISSTVTDFGDAVSNAVESATGPGAGSKDKSGEQQN